MGIERTQFTDADVLDQGIDKGNARRPSHDKILSLIGHHVNKILSECGRVANRPPSCYLDIKNLLAKAMHPNEAN